MKVAYGSDNPEAGGVSILGPGPMMARSTASRSRRKKTALALAVSSLLASGALLAYHVTQNSSLTQTEAVTSASTSTAAADRPATMDLSSDQQSTLDAVMGGARFVLRVPGKNNLCVDDGNGWTAASSHFLLWDCDTNNVNQVFTYDAAAHRLRNPIKNLCVDDAGGWPGLSRFLLWHCEPGNRNQDFVYEAATKMFRNPSQPNMCMDDGGGWSRGERKFTPWYCDVNNANQRFEFVLVPDVVHAVPPVIQAGQEILLRSRGKSNLCLDDGGGTKWGETKMGFQPCNPSNPNQIFVYDGATYQLRSARKDNLCVDDGDARTPGGAKFQMWGCDKNLPNQRFVMDGDTLMLKNPTKNNLCMDDGNVQYPTSASVVLWTCDNNNPNQHFEVLNRAELAAEQQRTLDAVYGGAKFIIRVAGKHNLCLDDGNGQTAASSQYLDWDCDVNNPNQAFVYDPATKRFRSKRKGFCLDDGGGWWAAQTRFVLWHCDVNNKNQDFEYDPATMMFRNPHKPGLCMDDGGCYERGSKRVLMWHCDLYNPNQHFEFILAPPPAAHATPLMLQAGQEILLRARGKNNLCVDDGGGQKNGESQLGLQPCNPSNPNQIFLYESKGNLIRSARKNNLCVDDGGATTAAGAKFTLWECDADNNNQRFTFDDGTLMFRNPAKNDLCMDDGGATRPTASSFVLWHCDNNNPNQHFEVVNRAEVAAEQQKTLDAVYGGSPFIMRIAGKDNLCVDDGNGQTAAASKLTPWTCDFQNPNQVFVYDAATKRLRSKRKGLCVDDGGGWTAASTRFVLWHCDVHNRNQDFEYDPATMLFKNPHKNLCWDDGNAPSRGATQFLLWYCDVFNPNQRIEFLLLPPRTEYAVPPMLLAGQEIMLKLRGKGDLCVDDGGAQSSGESQLGGQPCNPSNPNQLFIYDSKSYQLRSARKHNLCVDDGGATRDGEAMFTMYTCDADNANQQFVFDDATLMFRNPAKNNLCMDDGGITQTSVSSFWLWSCDDSNPNQHFEVVNAAEVAAQQQQTLDAVFNRGAPFVMRVGGKNNLCVDDGNGQWAAASQFLLWDCDVNNPNQVFVWDAASKRIRSASKNLCVDDGGGWGSGHTKFVLYHCDPHNLNQDFEYDATTMMFRNPHKDNLCIDDGGTGERGSARMHLWDCHPSNPNQHFDLMLAPTEVKPELPDETGQYQPPIEITPEHPTPDFQPPIELTPERPDILVEHPTPDMPWQSTDDEYIPEDPTHVPIGFLPVETTPEHPDETDQYLPVEFHHELPDESGHEHSPLAFPTDVNVDTESDSDAYLPAGPTDVPAAKVSDVVALITPQEMPAQPVDPDVRHPTFNVTLFNASSPMGAGANDSADWNLLSPSHATVGFVDADQSNNITAQEIFAYLASIRARAEQRYEVMLYKYDRTLKCVSAGLQELAKEPVTPDEYHVLVRWMYSHCAAGNDAVDPNADANAAPLTQADADKLPAVEPLVNDSSADVDRLYMTKLEFYFEIKSFFDSGREELFGHAAASHLRAEEMAQAEKRLEECMQAASERFGSSAIGEVGGTANATARNATEDFATATKWVSDECMVTGVAA